MRRESRLGDKTRKKCKIGLVLKAVYKYITSSTENEHSIYDRSILVFINAVSKFLRNHE